MCLSTHKLPWGWGWSGWATSPGSSRCRLLHFCLENLILRKNPTEFSLWCSRPFATSLWWKFRGSTCSVWPHPPNPSHTLRVCTCSPPSCDSVYPKTQVLGSDLLWEGWPLPRWGKWSTRNMAATWADLQTVLLLSTTSTWPPNFWAFLGLWGPDLPVSRHWYRNSSFHPQAFCFWGVAITFPSVSRSYLIGFMPPQNLISVTCVGFERNYCSVVFSRSPVLLTKCSIHTSYTLYPALALDSPCLLNTQRSKCWAMPMWMYEVREQHAYGDPLVGIVAWWV